jgi:hypothetical protein
MPTAAFSPATIVVRNDGFMEAEIDNEIVALSVETGMCYGLDPIGARIWRLLADPIGVADICEVLAKEYQVEFDTCRRDVLALLEELRAEGIIRQAVGTAEDAAKGGN